MIRKSDISNRNTNALSRLINSVNSTIVKVFTDGRLVFLERQTNTLYLLDTTLGEITKNLKG